jgi:uncharacterized protein YjbI with pentapeptide repeats
MFKLFVASSRCLIAFFAVFSLIAVGFAAVPGNHSVGSSYATGSLVIYNGITYIANQDVSFSQDPSSSSAWSSLDTVAGDKNSPTGQPSSTPDTSNLSGLSSPSDTNSSQSESNQSSPTQYAGSVVDVVPTLVNFQGTLLNSQGQPFTGNVQASLKVFGSSAGANEIYSESIGAISVTNGLYGFRFGSGGSSDFTSVLLGNKEAWLEVSLDGDPLSPRQRLVAVPYALVSKAVGAGGVAVVNGSLALSPQVNPPGATAGQVMIYAKSDGNIYAKDENGKESPLFDGGTGVTLGGASSDSSASDARIAQLEAQLQAALGRIASIESSGAAGSSSPALMIQLGHKELPGANLAGSALRGLDLTKGNYAGANLFGASVKTTNLSEADLSSAILSQADFNSSNLFGANLTSADLSQADFNNSNLSGANLTSANLSGAKLHGLTLSGTNLSYANLTNATIRSAFSGDTNATGATFVNADFEDQNLNGIFVDANFSNARLSGANLAGVYDGIHAEGVDFRQSTFGSFTMRGASLAGANLAGVNLRHAKEEPLSTYSGWGSTPQTYSQVNDFHGTDFTGANLDNADLRVKNLSNANFERVSGSGANFGAIHFTIHTHYPLPSGRAYDPPPDYSGPISTSYQTDYYENIVLKVAMNDIDASHSIWIGANFTGADLTGSNFTGANLTNATFKDANLTGVVFTNATFSNTTMPDGSIQN